MGGMQPIKLTAVIGLLAACSTAHAAAVSQRAGLPGIWSLPNGEALYRNAIREHVQTALDPDAIFNEGMREVSMIRAQMLEVAAKLGFADLATFNSHIFADPTLHGTSGEQLLGLYRGYEQQSLKKRDQVLPAPLGTPLEVVPMDDFRAVNALPADYSPGSNAGGRPGRVNVNLYHPADRLLLNVEAIAYHEGVPGHHLQFSFADGLKDVPAFRRFASYDAYSEGWALYAEQLGKELGFYQDPYSEYGRLPDAAALAIDLSLPGLRLRVGGPRAYTPPCASPERGCCAGRPRSSATISYECSRAECSKICDVNISSSGCVRSMNAAIAARTVSAEPMADEESTSASSALAAGGSVFS